MGPTGESYLRKLLDGMETADRRGLSENLADSWFVAIGATDALAHLGFVSLEDAREWLRRFARAAGRDDLAGAMEQPVRAKAEASNARPPTPVQRVVPVLRGLNDIQIVTVELSANWILVRWQPLAGQTEPREVDLRVFAGENGTEFDRFHTTLFPLTGSFSELHMLVGMCAFVIHGETVPQRLSLRIEEEAIDVELPEQ